MSAGLESLDANRQQGMAWEWIYAITVSVTSFVALCFVYSEEAVGAYRVWVSSATYNHCFLILPIVIFMIWRRRDLLASVVPRPDIRFVILIVPLLFVWEGAHRLGLLEGQQLVVMTIFQTILLATLGGSAYRKLLAPLLYLYFLVPTAEFLVPALQDFTARFAVLGLQLFGVPVFSDGIIIEVPAGDFIVAEACAGLRFLIAAVAFGVFYAVEMYESRYRRAAFIALSIVVPIVANGLRAFGLIMAAEAFGTAAAIEADHVTYGWFFFSVVLMILILIGRLFSDRNDDPIAEVQSRDRAQSRNSVGLWSFILPATLSVGLAGLAPMIGSSWVLQLYL